MRRVGVMLALILLTGGIEAFAQSTEEEIRAKLAEGLAQLDQTSPRLFYGLTQSRKSTNAATDALQTGLQGTWWREATWIKTLDLTPDQRKKMDDAFLQNRIRLIDLTAALEKEEVLLEPLVESIHPGDEAKILAQIDKVADARAGLEKANARMLLAIREILTQDQWVKLQSNRAAGGYIFGKNGIISGWSASPSIPAPK